MQRIRITVTYDGTCYHGWQVQPGLPTVQGKLQEILESIEGKPVLIEGSGRTDAGVHALAQVAAFNLENPIPLTNLRKAMNRLLEKDIRVTTATYAVPEFHPRFQAVAKTYEYRILRAEICSPFEHRYVLHHPYRLDESRMMAASSLLKGAHDFTNFASSDDTDDLGKSKVRTIFESSLVREGDRLIYRVRGRGFLKHMVRNIVGVLLEVGKGNLGEADIEARLRPGSGIPPGPSVPAKGLFLVSVEYPAVSET